MSKKKKKSGKKVQSSQIALNLISTILNILLTVLLIIEKLKG